MKIIEHMSGKQHISRDIMLHIGKYVEETKVYYHSHEFMEIQYVLSGSGIQIIEDKEFRVSVGDVSYTNFVTKHSFISDSKDNPLIVYNCIFFPEYLENINLESGALPAQKMIYDSKLFNMPYFMFKDEEKRILSVLEQMDYEYSNAEEWYEKVLRGYFIALINIMNRFYCKQADEKIFMVRDADINKVIMYIEKNYREKISLDSLSKIAHLSPNYLCSKFKAVTNTTVVEYINKKRLREMCRLLRDTTMSFTEIATSVGYTNINYIRKIFKKEFGESPLEYRRRMKKQ